MIRGEIVALEAAQIRAQEDVAVDGVLYAAAEIPGDLVLAVRIFQIGIIEIVFIALSCQQGAVARKGSLRNAAVADNNRLLPARFEML